MMKCEAYDNLMGSDDRYAILYSVEDNCWVAHSILTGQIGTGDSPADALADAIIAVRQVVALADADPSIAVFWDETVSRRLRDGFALLQAAEDEDIDPNEHIH